MGAALWSKPDAKFIEHPLELFDGGTLPLHEDAQASTDPKTPVLLILPGLTGSSNT
jgi:hypothetical protein